MNAVLSGGLSGVVARVYDGDREVDSDIAPAGLAGCVSVIQELSERHQITKWTFDAGPIGSVALLHNERVIQLAMEHGFTIEGWHRRAA